MAIWPDQLPAITIDGYGLQPQSTFVRTDMDQGPARQRRRFTVAPTLVPVRWVMTLDQFRLFEGWYRHRISDGAAGFTADIRNGLGRVSVSARFVEPWSATEASPNHFTVTGTWEVTDRPVMSDADLTAEGI